jgi:hypothetical protein
MVDVAKIRTPRNHPCRTIRSLESGPHAVRWSVPVGSLMTWGPCTALLDAWQPSKGAPIHNDRHNQEKKVENQTCILDQQVQQIQFSVNQRIGDKFSKTCAHIYFQRDGIFILLNSVHCSVQGNQPNKSNINLEATIIEYPSQRSFMSCKLLTR